MMKYDCCELAMMPRLGMVTDACCSALNSRSRRRDILRYNIFKSTTTLIPGVFNNMRCCTTWWPWPSCLVRNLDSLGIVDWGPVADIKVSLRAASKSKMYFEHQHRTQNNTLSTNMSKRKSQSYPARKLCHSSYGPHTPCPVLLYPHNAHLCR